MLNQFELKKNSVKKKAINIQVNLLSFILDCDCDLQGTDAEVCDKQFGKCLCNEGYGGLRCDQCVSTYYNYPDCIKCNCSAVGSVSFACDTFGKCPCLSNFAAKQCTQCSAGYYDYPQCLCRLYETKMC